jgi:hypothetical protein
MGRGGDRDDWRAIRTFPALKRPQSLKDKGGALLSALSEVDLAFAAQNPAYPETARDSARLALSGKIGAPQALRRIETFVQTLPPESRLKPADVADDRAFFGLGRGVRAILNVLAAASVVAGIGVALSPLDGWRFAAWLPLILAPIWLLAVGLRAKPARILLLRLGGARTDDRGFAALARNELRPYGHVFALAETMRRAPSWRFLSLNPVLLVWRMVNLPLGFLVRMFDRSRAGPIVVATARDFRRFVHRIADRWSLNFAMLRTSEPAVMVRASDAWRRHVVTLLVNAADVIVVDVADGSDMPSLSPPRVRCKIVFVARDEDAESAQAALRAHGFADMAETLVLFGERGKPSDRDGLRAAMLGAIRRRLAAA